MICLQPTPERTRAAVLTLVVGFAWTVALPQTTQANNASTVPTIEALRDGFHLPPPAARLRCYWWWLNGHTDKMTITHDLEEMKAKGFGGVLLVDANGANQNGNKPVPAGPMFGTPAWVELFTHALGEADRLGLEMTFNITSGWNLGGPDIKPEQASKLLTYTQTQITGGSTVTILLPAPPTKRGFYRQIAVLAYPLQHGIALAEQPDDSQGDRHTGRLDEQSPDAISALRQRAAATLRFRSAAAETGFSMPDSSAMLNDSVRGSRTPSAGGDGYSDTTLSGVQDLSSKMTADGLLRWTAPVGEWEVLRVGYTDSGAMVSTSSGEWQGLAIDYLSRTAFTQYWERTVEPLLAAAKPYHSLRYLASDSWELGGTNWTDDFRGQFERLRGYDPVPWLPVVAGRIVSDRAQSTRFLTDLRRTVADLAVTEHYDVFAEKARQHGMGVQAESGGPHGAPIDALETFRRAAVPQTEFWSQSQHRNTDVERFFTKEAASAANIYGQRLVAQEGETSIGPQWSESLATDLKPSFDMAITEGMNRLVWHEFTSSPESTGTPGQEYFAGTHLNPKVTWWNAGSAFFTYLNRAQFLMQQGTAVDDVLYFYGDNVPNFVRLKADDPGRVLPGYDYDVSNEDALLHSITMQGGSLSGPGGVQWKVLVIPKTRRLSLEVLRRVESYVASGGVVAGLTPDSPTGMTTPQIDAQFREIVGKVWGSKCDVESHHSYGKGQVFCTQNTHSVLLQLKVRPDVELAALGAVSTDAHSTSAFDYVHRQIGRVDVYFVRNGSDRKVDYNAIFRIQGRTPELWDAVSGETRMVPRHSILPDGRVQVGMSLPAFGSIFVVFAEAGADKLPTTSELKTVPFQTVTPWAVNFPAGHGATEKTITIKSLTSWTEWPEPGVRFFSGTATYRATAIAPTAEAGKQVWMRFDDLRDLARVRINGQEAGTIWAKPLSLRVDSMLKPGKNEFEIEVTNLWPNRIIGDLQPGKDSHLTGTNITAYKADSPLLPSGLIGSINWEIER